MAGITKKDEASVIRLLKAFAEGHLVLLAAAQALWGRKLSPQAEFLSVDAAHKTEATRLANIAMSQGWLSQYFENQAGQAAQLIDSLELTTAGKRKIGIAVEEKREPVSAGNKSKDGFLF